MAENDFEVNRKAEEEAKVVLELLVHQDRLLGDIIGRLVRLEESRAESDRQHDASHG